MNSKSKAAAPQKKATKEKFQAKTMPVNLIRQQMQEAHAEVQQQVQQLQQVVSPDPSEQQELQQQELVVESNNVPNDSIDLDAAEPSQSQDQDDYEAVEQRKFILEKAPKFASKKSINAPAFQQQKKYVKNFDEATPKLRRFVPPANVEKSVDVTTLLASKPPDVFYVPSKFLTFFDKEENEVVSVILMKEMRQVADIHFYWARSASKTFSSVTKLDVSFCSGISDLGVRWITDYFPALKELNLTGCRQLTESSLRTVITKSDRITNATFDMTSVRYVPPHPLTLIVSTKACPLIINEAAVAKAKPSLPNDLPGKFSAAKIVVIKPVEMRDKQVAESYAKPDGDVVGSTSFVRSFRSGPYRFLECTEDMAVQLLVSDNCIAVLPFDASTNNVQNETYSIESRFNLVASLVKNAVVIAAPFADPSSQDATKSTEAIKAEIEAMIKKAESGESKQATDEPNFPTDNRLATLRYLMEHGLHFASSPAGVLPLVTKNLPHADIPKSVLILHQALEKSTFLTQKETIFFTVEHFIHSLGKNAVNPELQPCWSSFVSLLAETGNLWLESYTGATDGPSIGSRHVSATFSSLLKFFTDFNAAADSTAAIEDIPCLAFDTPICTVEHVRRLIGPGAHGGLSDDDCSRLLTSFEANGLAIFRRRSALALNSLRQEPPVSVRHFLEPEAGLSDAHLSKSKVAKKEAVRERPKSPTEVFTINYPLMCRPSSLFSSLIAVLVKIVPPTLLWRNGAFFYEASFLETLLSFDDSIRVVTLRFSAEKFALDGLASTTTTSPKGVERLKAALRGSCSFIHSACCSILSPFSNVDLSKLGDPHGIKFMKLSLISHKVDLLPQRSAETFSRQLDVTMGRCEHCLLDANTISALRRVSLRQEAAVTESSILRWAEDKSKPTMILSLGNWSPVGEIGCSGLQPTFVDVMSVESVQAINIYPGSISGSTKDYLKLSFGDGGKLVDYSIEKVVAHLEKPSSSSSKALPSKDAKKQPEPKKSANKTAYLITSGLRIEARPSSKNTPTVTISVNGQTVFEANFGDSRSNVVTLVYEPKKGVVKKELPVSCLASSDQKRISVLGMSLEAVDLQYPNLIAVAHVKEIGPDGRWMISFDRWDPRYDYWADPTSENIFPCGFMEYCSKQNLFEELQQQRGRSTTPQLQPPKNVTKYGHPFPWQTYFEDMKREDPALVASPVPLSCFGTKHLLGFSEDASNDWYRGVELNQAYHDETTMTSYATQARTSMLLNNTAIFSSDSDRGILKSPCFVPLPNLTWTLCCWPSREKLASIGAARPNFVCAWPDFIHFVNETPDAMNVPRTSLNAVAPLSLAVILMKILNQPRFIPDEFDQLFGDLQTDCPFVFSCMSVKSSGAANNKAAHVEHCLRQYLLPFLLDYLTVHACYAEQKNAQHGNANAFPMAITDDWSLLESSASVFDTYLRRLHAEGASVSRSSAVTVTQEKPKPKCRLLNMQEAESEFFSRDSFCPKLMCGQHAYHYTTFTRATEIENKLDWASSLHSFGHFHDEFVTMCALNADDVKDLKQPVSSLHPFITELIGPVGNSLDKVGVFSLKWLSELVLFKNEITDLPLEVAQLAPTLERLDLSYNPLSEIPKVVYQLTALQSLRCDSVPLKSLDEQIGNLSKLKSLSLRGNCLTVLPSTFKSLVDLEFLDLSGLPSFPSTSTTVYLEEVASFFDKNCFPKEANLILTKWAETEGSTSLDRAGIQRLNEHLFKTLPRMTMVADSFPIEWSAYGSIEELRLANQPMKTYPEPAAKLVNLARLDLSGCLLLETISPKIADCPLEALNLNNCPALKTPPLEIRRRGFVATLAYFRRLAQGSVTCKRTKLMFVGLGGAGKTSLVHSLIADVEPAATKFEVTDGIDIKNWTVDCKDGSTVDFRMWDFAGQVVYYNTHQFFISSRAVYLLLWNIRLGHEHAGLEFWLSSIACHAPNAPILIVGTHADEVSQERSFLPEVNYRERFSSICGFHYVSSYTGQGIEALKADIIKVAVAQKHMGEAIPVAWLNFEEKLLKNEPQQQEPQTQVVAQTTSQDNSILMFDRVEHLASGCGIYDPDEIDQALQFLSDLGTIQYFRTDFLRDRVIINPQWIVDVMACVVSVKKATIKDGRLPHKDVLVLWESYPKELHTWLLKLTEAFDLTFPLKKEPVSIVPCLLPENPPENLNWPNLEDNPGFRQTKLIFSFKYLPSGLFNRVQVRLCQFSDGATMWRRGSLLRKNQHFALLSQPDASSIHVKVQGPCPDNIAFLVLEVVDTLIMEAFQGVQPDYLFSCPACVNARASEPSMFERSRIRRAFELRIPFLQCWNYFHSVSTQELRQLFPAESSSEFDSQFSRTIQEISNIRQSLKIDILVIGCSADADPNDAKNSVSTPEVGKDLEKAFPQSRVVVIGNPDAASDAISFDQLSVMMRSARLLVFCLSDKFMASDRCQAAFFTGRETLRKQVLMILIRDFDWNKYSALAFQMNDDVFVKAINRGRYRPTEIATKIEQRLNQETSGSVVETQKKYPDVFISYCWQNSQDAVGKGTKSTQKALGATDPRALKKFLADNKFECWLDIEQVGLGGLFRDIADGIRHAQIVVVCVSDEYVKSENCLREFHFATTSCHLPVILCAVGTGGEWQTSEVNLIVCHSATFINFQVDAKENYDTLVGTLRNYVKEPTDDLKAAALAASVHTTMPLPVASKKVTLGTVGRLKTMSNIQADLNQPVEQRKTDAKQSSLVLHEMIELGQRKFLRQLVGFSESAGSRAYPRLVMVDVQSNASNPSETAVKTDETSKEEKDGEKPASPGESNEETGQRGTDDDALAKLTWRIRFLCEHEGGWHPTDVSFALTENPVQVINQSANYLGQLMSFVRHGSLTSSLEVFSTRNDQHSTLCRDALAQIERMVNPDQSFDSDYCNFRDRVISLDQHGCNGGLKKCQLALGKELWLCPLHQSSVNSRSKSQTDAANNKEGEQTNNDDKDEESTANSINNGGSVRQRVHKPVVINKSSEPGKGASSDSSSQQSPGEQSHQASSSAVMASLHSQATSRACVIQ